MTRRGVLLAACLVLAGCGTQVQTPSSAGSVSGTPAPTSTSTHGSTPRPTRTQSVIPAPPRPDASPASPRSTITATDVLQFGTPTHNMGCIIDRTSVRCDILE